MKENEKLEAIRARDPSPENPVRLREIEGGETVLAFAVGKKSFLGAFENGSVEMKFELYELANLEIEGDGPGGEEEVIRECLDTRGQSVWVGKDGRICLFGKKDFGKRVAGFEDRMTGRKARLDLENWSLEEVWE